MVNIFVAKSMVFYPDYFENKCQAISDHIIIPSHTLSMIIDRFNEDESVFLMKLQNTNTNQEVIVSIGIPHYYEKDTIYAPQWILDMIGCTGNCDTPVKLSMITEIIPLATSITIKPLDPLAFKVDLVECFQKVLENLCTLQEGTTIPVIIPELGNYEYLAYIEKVEPRKISRTHKDDLAVEFLRDFEEQDEEMEPATQMVSVNNTPIRGEPVSYSIPITPPKEEPQEIISEEERRRRVRESWLNRFACVTSRQPQNI